MLYTCYIHASCVVESIYMYFDGPFVLHIYSSTHFGATKPETTPETRHAYVVENKMKKKKGAAREPTQSAIVFTPFRKLRYFFWPTMYVSTDCTCRGRGKKKVARRR